MSDPLEEFNHQYSPLRRKDVVYYLVAIMLAALLFSYLKAHGGQLQAQECNVTHQNFQLATSYTGKFVTDNEINIPKSIETNGVRL